jgi:hypothetical protein
VKQHDQNVGAFFKVRQARNFHSVGWVCKDERFGFTPWNLLRAVSKPGLKYPAPRYGKPAKYHNEGQQQA